MMTLAYLAFVHRTSMLNAPLPLTPAAVIQMLASKPLEGALRSIRDYSTAVRSDPALKMSPLLALLSYWLEEAGLHELLEHPAQAANLGLARTVHYADTFFIRIVDDDAPTPSKTLVWKLEGALNRFLNLVRRFPESPCPTMEQCLDADREFFASFAGQQPRFEESPDLPTGDSDGQWQTRLRISASIENLVAPYRLEARFRYDRNSGEVLFDLRAPNSDLFASGMPEPTEDGPSPDDMASLQRAQLYAMRAGLFYAAAAFEAAPSVNLVRVIASPLSEEASVIDGDRTDGSPIRPWFDVAFSRESYAASNGWAAQRIGNPISAYGMADDGSTCTSVPLFDGLDPLPNFWEQSVSLDELGAPVCLETKWAWQATTRREMTIEFNAGHRIVAKSIADSLATCTETSQAIRTIRQIQEATPELLDGQPASRAFTRLMEALAQGALEPRDADAVISCFQSDDPCRSAYQRAQELEQSGDEQEAVKILADAVVRASEQEGYSDNDDTAYHVFDSYWSRLLYNLQRSGRLEGPECLSADKGKTVQLAPDYLYFCLMDLVNLLEGAFEGSEDAIRYGKAAVALAPTTGVAYRLLGRAYMLIGELGNAFATLQQGLCVTQGADDIAIAYYQLAYVLWHSGKPDLGALCYAKSIMTSPIYADAATNELNQLKTETGIELPEPSEVDDLLNQAGIVVAPVAKLGKLFLEGAAAAADEGLLPATRSLLAVVWRNYSKDDALMGIVNSLIP